MIHHDHTILATRTELEFIKWMAEHYLSKKERTHQKSDEGGGGVGD